MRPTRTLTRPHCVHQASPQTAWLVSFSLENSVHILKKAARDGQSKSTLALSSHLRDMDTRSLNPKKNMRSGQGSVQVAVPSALGEAVGVVLAGTRALPGRLPLRPG